MKMTLDQPADALRAAGPPGGTAAELRRRAEERLQTQEPTPQSAPDPQRLVHELQVHRIELEMQNEELRQAHAQMGALMARYIDLYDFAPTGYITHDRQGTIGQLNLAAARLLGAERGQLVNRRLGLFVTDGDRRVFSDFVRKVFASQTQECCEVTLPQGGHRPLSVRIEGRRSADGQQCLAAVVDLTEHKQTEEALRESGEQFRAMFDVASIGIAQADPRSGQWLRVNRKMCAITGYSADELLRARVLDITHPEDRQKDWEAFQQVVRGEAPAYRMEKRYLRKDGTLVWVNVNMTVIRNAASQPVRTIATVEDITERKAAEERIRSQAELLDLAQDAIAVRDMNGCVQYWNMGSERLTGWTAAEALGKPIIELVKPDRGIFDVALRVLLKEGHWSGEQTILTKDGRSVTTMSRWTLVRDERGQPKSVLSINTDMTEQKKLEAQFLRAQRMESVGRLAGGIAHDLNNILAPILMGTSLLREGMPLAEAGPLIDIIANSAQRGADIVRQLLTFARGTEGQKIPVPLSRLIKEMGKIIQETFPKSITLRTDCPKDLWTIMGDPTHLHQILLNLVNARDAMRGGGTLTLAAENVTLDDCYTVMSPEAKAGPYVVLQVSDTGTGMPPEILDEIFDPFFTTKGPEKGTGLGLATVQGIVKSHAGFIQVESQVGQGSHFRVYLPALPAAAVPAAATPAPELPQGHGQLVLVVDDEQSVRDITGRILEKCGYRVLTANDGAAAIALYAQHQAEIRVVLIDMMMPVMDGAATVRALRGMNAQVKIIAASGAASKPRLAEVVDLSVQAYLQKPFTSQKLLVTLDQVLRGQPTQW